VRSVALRSLLAELRQGVVEIGDTAVDVSSAREAGIQSLRVGPGTGLADALAQLG
jgi:phosphoglycolate phosphatase-like HAD superfamily hydrolase